MQQNLVLIAHSWNSCLSIVSMQSLGANTGDGKLRFIVSSLCSATFEDENPWSVEFWTFLWKNRTVFLIENLFRLDRSAHSYQFAQNALLLFLYRNRYFIGFGWWHFGCLLWWYAISLVSFQMFWKWWLCCCTYSEIWSDGIFTRRISE